ncbi:MAG TPA: c-type cytochrome, partial [Burkholderiales bacterium]|nr:c-type cytochrome [Burkholderiales bacterium]
APPVTAEPQTTPPWAYTLLRAGMKPPADDGKPQQLPGSKISYSWTEIRNLFSAKDWFPEEHPAMPEVVARGRKPDVYACGMCHYPNGQGKPENASIAGLPAAYIVQQMADYKSGLRKSAEPRMRPPALMLHLAKQTTDAEVRAAADYYAALKYKQWIRLVETDSVVRTEVIIGSMLAPIEGGGKEPLGQRIIETAEDLERVELRDSRVGFVAYVPTGSIAKGEALAAGGGGRTIACSICHGKDLKGLADVPALAARSPTYMFRQLYDIKSGARAGNGAQLMKAVVEQLTPEDMIALAAYAASRAP